MEVQSNSTLSYLDFDIETVAAGFADPQWVPNTVIAWACSVVGSGEIRVKALPVAYWHDNATRRRFLEPLLDAIGEANVLTGHNIIRFDLPVLNAECMRLMLPTLKPTLVQDTIKFPKSKGFKKGQDNLGVLFGIEQHKHALNWQEWQHAYGEYDLATVKDRVRTDVVMHMELREALREQDLLQTPKLWRG